MKLNLRAKLVLSSVTVILLTGSIATAVGVSLIGSGILREAQNKVDLDLNSASRIFNQKLATIKDLLKFSAMKNAGGVTAIRRGDYSQLQDNLKGLIDIAGLDFLTVTDSRGTVVLRLCNPGRTGDSQSGDQIIRQVIVQKRPFAHAQILSAETLVKEAPSLAKQARITILPTPHARPAKTKVSTDGMVLKAAAPFLDNGTLIGVLYGGILLNRNYEIVDTIKDVVYRGVQYKGKETGTATIFQKDLRIATNVMLDNGRRAIGTRVSGEVYHRVLEEGKIWTARAFVVNDWYLTAYKQIKDIAGKPIGMLYVGMLEKKYQDMKQMAFWIFVGLCVAGALVSLVIAYIFSEFITRPVQLLRKGVQALEGGDFDYRIHLTAKDEIGSLAESFNTMSSQLKDSYARLKGKVEAADEDLKQAYRELQEKQETLVQKEKLASIGQLSAGVAHELNNPLGTILVFSHMLLKELPEEDPRRNDIKMIVSEADRCRNIVRGLLNFARQSKISKEPADLKTIILEVIPLMSAKAAEQNVTLTTELPDGLPELSVDRTQITQMLVNIIDNGIDAIDKAGVIRVTADMLPDGKSVEIKISDTGCGLSEGQIIHLFTPFFTTKEMGKGTGLGLAIAYGIVKMHSGSITVESAPGMGTTFIIHLPVS